MTIISIDDNTVNLLLIEALTKEMVGIEVKSFTSAKEGLGYLAYNSVDIILTDYMMPEMHGIDFIKTLRRTNTDVPVVMITAVTDDKQLKIDALEAGATEFLNKPLNPAEFKARLTNLMNLRRAQLLLKDKALLLEDEVRKAVRMVEMREFEALLVLGKAAEYKDPDTSTHINRVASYSTLIMREYGANKHEQELMFYSAPLHDIGKIGIPDVILSKPGLYTPEEFDVMKRHPIIGYEMIKDADSPYLLQGAEIALTHHEKYNGKGYPYGLKGTDIPLTGRVLAIADVFDALTSARPYKEAWPIDKAVGLLKNERGEHFDPKLVDLFTGSMDKVLDIYARQKENPLKFSDFN
jgi:putative two-component system response regulator